MSESQTDSRPQVLKSRVGIVVSTKMDKTIVVEFIARVPHPRFKKIVKQTKKFYVHDENSEAALGDKVRITETRPMSKNKRWRLVEVLTH
jgi:small subunit ribosomal protein S17